MRCLQHVFLRGAMAVGLLVSAGAGTLVLPQPAQTACPQWAPLADRATMPATARSPAPRAYARPRTDTREDC